MIEVYNYCKGCSSRRQLFTYYNSSSPKKLLVAISVVAIITMCIIPTEARSVEHKKRHDRNHKSIPRTTKDTSRRHNKRTDIVPLTKESLRKPKNPKAESYTTEFNKIMRKVRNTKSHYNNDWKQLQPDLQPFKEVSMPNWLPTVNFVDVHYHNYRRGRRNDTSSIPERKYAYQVPKLYKSLLDFYDLFKQLDAFRLNFPDDPYNSYKRKRKQILNRTLGHLYSTIQEVKDSMFDVKLNLTLPDRKKTALSQLNLDVDSTQCFKNDYLAFRAYGNMLQNWYLELRCKGEKHVTKSVCKQFFRKLTRKRATKTPSSTKRRGHAT